MLVAVGMTAFLGMLGLVIDVGQIFMERVRLVRAVDAAVLAGVQELPLQPKAALISAYEYALANSLTPEDLQVGISEQNHIISAYAQKQVSLSFLSLFGFKQLQVSAEAAAMIGPVVGCTGVIPVGVPWDDFEFGQVYELKIDAHSGRNIKVTSVRWLWEAPVQIPIAIILNTATKGCCALATRFILNQGTWQGQPGRGLSTG